MVMKRSHVRNVHGHTINATPPPHTNTHCHIGAHDAGVYSRIACEFRLCAANNGCLFSACDVDADDSQHEREFSRDAMMVRMMMNLHVEYSRRRRRRREPPTPVVSPKCVLCAGLSCKSRSTRQNAAQRAPAAVSRFDGRD